jgi:hypothetical protein
VPRTKAPAKPEAPAPPAVRWVLKPGEEMHGCGAVYLKGVAYLVSPIFEDPWAEYPTLAGYRFRNLDTGEPRDVDLRTLECSCPHYLYRCRRGGLCKHLAALKEILP